jgi:hypothetical protein
MLVLDHIIRVVVVNKFRGKYSPIGKKRGGCEQQADSPGRPIVFSIVPHRMKGSVLNVDASSFFYVVKVGWSPATGSHVLTGSPSMAISF